MPNNLGLMVLGFLGDEPFSNFLNYLDCPTYYGALARRNTQVTAMLSSGMRSALVVVVVVKVVMVE